jgi:hypothetical protein
MKIIEDYPPNYETICEAIPSVKDKKDVVFTYGDTIYNPYGGEIQDHLDLHESIHEKQQAEIGIEAWWNKYLSDKKFRLEQEVEAYHVQYQFVFKEYGRAVATVFLREIANDLSGGMYGNVLDRKQARKAILKK